MPPVTGSDRKPVANGQTKERGRDLSHPYQCTFRFTPGLDTSSILFFFLFDLPASTRRVTATRAKPEGNDAPGEDADHLWIKASAKALTTF